MVGPPDCVVVVVVVIKLLVVLALVFYKGAPSVSDSSLFILMCESVCVCACVSLCVCCVCGLRLILLVFCLMCYIVSILWFCYECVLCRVHHAAASDCVLVGRLCLFTFAPLPAAGHQRASAPTAKIITMTGTGPMKTIWRQSGNPLVDDPARPS